MGYYPPIDQNLALLLAIVCTVVGICALLWLVFFTVYGRELPRREKITGTTIRLVIMSVFMGFGAHFWTLVDLF